MSNLTISDLFTPEPSGVDPTNQQASPATGTWLETVLAAGARIGLSTTSWQPGDPTRTLLAILSVVEAQQDGIASLMIQGGFLDWAATGTVTYETAPGVTVTAYVTPDPSIQSQNPTGAPGWLDVLANEVYAVTREQATFAGGQLYVVNESGSTYTYGAGSFHVVNELTTASPPPTYSNIAGMSLTPSPNTGITGMSVSGTLVTLTVASSSGLSVGQIVFVDGTGNDTVDGTWQKLAAIPSGSTVQFTSAAASGTASTGSLYAPQAFDFRADLLGPASNAVAGGITGLITTQLGVECFNPSSFVGANWESNPALVNRCRLRLAALSPSGPSGAYVYFALTSFQILANDPILVPASGGGTTPVTLVNGPITRAIKQLDTMTGVVTVTIANADAAVDGATHLIVTGVTAATPAVVTISGTHDMIDGDFAYVAGVQGVSGVDGYWQVTRTASNKFSLNGSVGTGSYVAGGVVECGDLGMVDLIIDDNALPDALSEVTQWAGEDDLTLAATVYVPATQVQAYRGAMADVLTAYFATVPIGGVSNVESNNVIPIDVVIGLLYAAGIQGAGQTSYVVSVSGVTINGDATDAAIGPTNVPTLSGGVAGIIVVGV